MKAAFVTLFTLLLVSQASFAHGMNKAGPHGGFVRMPGNYHIELVPSGLELKVYFLDMNFKPLPINDATVEVILNGKKPITAQCLKEMQFFRCDTHEQSYKKFKEISIESSLNGSAEAKSVYKVPLKFM